MDLRGSSVLFSRVKSARIDTICRGTLLTALRDGHHLGMSERTELARRGRQLEYFTIGWNSLEGLIAVGAGALTGSISLVGFGVDSFIEVTSGTALLWRMATDADVCLREQRERLTLRLVGACFLTLSIYVGWEAGRDLVARNVPETSRVGIALACVSLVVMPLLSRAKRTVGRAMGSRAMHADARQTEFCTYLSAILLGGLVLNAALGWWWADPLAGLVMVPIIGKEGLNALRGETCCD
jgi:divalent metal cation (Fe/Co/Zn/Cd) transporter